MNLSLYLRVHSIAIVFVYVYVCVHVKHFLRIFNLNYRTLMNLKEFLIKFYIYCGKL